MTDTDKLAKALRDATFVAVRLDAICGAEGSVDRIKARDAAIRVRDALQAHAAEAAQPKTLALFTANQAQALLDAFGGSATTYALCECREGECAPLDDGSPSPAGLYIHDINCPEEGVIYLGDEDEDSEPRQEPQAAQPAAQAEPVAILRVNISTQDISVEAVTASPHEWDRLCADPRVLREGVPVYLHPPAQSQAARAAKRAERAEAELAALRARIAEAPFVSVRVDDDKHVSLGARSHPKDFAHLHGKRVRLVREGQ